jgi:hypothetical protein
MKNGVLDLKELDIWDLNHYDISVLWSMSTLNHYTSLFLVGYSKNFEIVK